MNGPAGLRLKNTVHLDGLRCDGAAYGGCQAGCLIFWRTEWLKPVADAGRRSNAGTGADMDAALQGGCTEEDVWAATRAKAQPDPLDPVYVCQATRLPYAAAPLPWWDVRQYIEDFTSGNVGLRRLLCGAIYACYYGATQAGIGLGRPLRWLYDRMFKWWGGCPFPRRAGAIPRGSPTPACTLNLRPGELVRIKSHGDILATLNADNKNRGLYFDAEAVPYCGGTYRVARRLTRLLDEKTGKLLRLKNDCIVLEGVTCQARYSDRRMFCPRAIETYWREIWLERVKEEGAAATDDQLAS